MSEHLLQQTLPPQMAVMADYYEQGVTPPTLADAAASRYGRFAEAGILPAGAGLDELVRVEVTRLAESALAADGKQLPPEELALRALAAFAAAGLVSREEAGQSLARFGADKIASSFEAAILAASTARDYSSATATPRRDMDPALATRLGIDPHRGLTQSEVAFLLNGQRTDGNGIHGQTKRAPSLPIGQLFGLDPTQRPTPEQIGRVLAGQGADGDPLKPGDAAKAVRRFLTALGVKAKTLSPEQREHILAGRAGDGSDLSDRQYQAVLETAKARIGYVDLTFSAPKSLSLAWAFAPTKAERAMMHQAHNDAIESVMRAVEREIGRASKGDSAKDGYEPGAIGWVSFNHYAARPTVEVIRTDEQGTPVTELHSLTGTGGRVPGDMQVHTHVAVFNAVQTASGRLGGLDLAQMEGRVHEWGALYQAFLAANLRTHGVAVDLDPRNEMARLPVIPEHVVAQFSKRTIGGTEAARAYARSQGLDWDSLDPDRKIGLLKSGVQNPREAKSDDVSDLAAWSRLAAKLGYQHRSVLRPDDVRPLLGRGERLELAYQTAMPLLAKQFERRAVIDGADARVAAAKGLIAAGVVSPEDVSAITHAFRERGVHRRGEPAALVWGMVTGRQGRPRSAVTTTLDIREENKLVATVAAGARDLSAALPRPKILAALAAFPALDFSTAHGKSQRAIIDKLATGGRIALALGVAGSGKSTLLKPLVRAWQDDGRAVHGIALAWRQSDDLAEAGIDKQNTRAVAAFLRGVETGAWRLDGKAVVVVDEIGLLGTRQLNDILAAQTATGFQLVMIGDPKQMQAVEAGPVIDLLRRALGGDNVPELGSSVRQKNAEERETALMFRNGQTRDAVHRKAANGTLRIVPGGYREAVLQVADLWAERREVNRDRPDFTITVSAATNAEAHDISLAIRERRRDLGEIGADRIVVAGTDAGRQRNYDLALAEGDRVRLFNRTNAKFTDTGTVGNIGRNGTVLDIVQIREIGLMLRAASGREGFVAWTTLRDAASGKMQLAYGDALTTNTAQGSTVSEHIHAVPGGSRLVSGFAAYTSGSRHGEQSFIVTSDGAERAEIIGRRPLGDRREVSRIDVLDNLTRNFARQPEKESALNLLDRAAGLRRGTIQGVQKSLQPLEARSGPRQSNPSLSDRFAQRRLADALHERLPGLTEQIRQQGQSIIRIIRAGTGLAERLAAIARRRMSQRMDARAYWSKLAAKARPRPEELSAAQKKVLRRRRRR